MDGLEQTGRADLGLESCLCQLMAVALDLSFNLWAL